MYHPKNKGGFGVKDEILFNLSLLAKWKWRLIHDDQSLWKMVLADKYRRGRDGRLGLCDEAHPKVGIQVVERFVWFSGGDRF